MNGMEERYCQSCGMPMGETNEMYGFNADGNQSGDYCRYCYQAGEFTSNSTMEEMIELCVPHVATAESGMSEGEARKMMREFFPALKRWGKA